MADIEDSPPLENDHNDATWFFRKYPHLIVKRVELHYPLTVSLLDKYKDKWDWTNISRNSAITWTPSLVIQFFDYLDWSKGGISENASVQWSHSLTHFLLKEHPIYLSSSSHADWTPSFIELHKDKWGWEPLSANTGIQWTADLIQKYANQWDWELLSNNESLPWTVELIEKFQDKWNWVELSGNQSLPWAIELLDQYLNKWDWQTLSSNEKLPWTVELIERFATRWEWSTFGLSLNKAIPWNEELLEKFSHRVDWRWISANTTIAWGTSLIDKFIERWDWSTLCLNDAVPWSTELIDRYSAVLNWSSLCSNSSICWTIELLNTYRRNLDFEQLSGSSSLPWGTDFIYEFGLRDKVIDVEHTRIPSETSGAYSADTPFIWDWEILSANEGIPWSIDLIDQYQNLLDWEQLVQNSSLPWSKNFYDQFGPRWPMNAPNPLGLGGPKYSPPSTFGIETIEIEKLSALLMLVTNWEPYRWEESEHDDHLCAHERNISAQSTEISTDVQVKNIEPNTPQSSLPWETSWLANVSGIPGRILNSLVSSYFEILSKEIYLRLPELAMFCILHSYILGYIAKANGIDAPSVLIQTLAISFGILGYPSVFTTNYQGKSQSRAASTLDISFGHYLLSRSVALITPYILIFVLAGIALKYLWPLILIIWIAVLFI